MCSHLFRASEIFGFKLTNERPTKFVTRNRQGRKKLDNLFRQNVNYNQPTQIMDPVPTEEPVLTVLSDKTNSLKRKADLDPSQDSFQQPKRGRGRPRKELEVVTDLNKQTRRRGRPPLVKPAIVRD